MDSINSRISEVISYLHLNRTAFAKSLGTSSSRIANITQGRNKPDSQLLTAIITNYPDIDAAWLLTGIGRIGRNVELPRNQLAEDYIEPNMSAALLGTLQTTLLEPLQPPKTASLEGSNGQNNSFNGSNDIPTNPAALLAANFDVESLESVKDAGRFNPWATGYVVELQQNQQNQHWLNIDRQLDLVLRRLLRVQELLQDLLGIRFDYDAYEAQKQKVNQQPGYDEAGYPVDPLAEMSEADKRAYYASRERLLERYEGQFTELLMALHNGIINPKSKYPPLRKGSAGEALRPFLDQRSREIYGEDEDE